MTQTTPTATDGESDESDTDATDTQAAILSTLGVPSAVLDEKLKEARTEVNTERGRTDGKAAAMLTAFGIPFAVLVATFPGRDMNPAAAVLVGLGAVGLVVAMLLVLLSVRPSRAVRPPGSFLYWAACTKPEEVIADVAVDRRAERLIVMSRLVEWKFAMQRVATDITSGSIVLLLLGLLVGMV